MKATQLLHNLGQSIWLDNITRDLLDNGTLKHYFDELWLTGLTSNPTIFKQAIKNSPAYTAAIRKEFAEGKSEEEVCFELALEDLARAADLFGPIYERTNGVDGWVSPRSCAVAGLRYAQDVAAAKDLYARAATRLQEEGAKSFVKSWDELMSQIASQGAVLRNAAG